MLAKKNIVLRGSGKVKEAVLDWIKTNNPKSGDPFMSQRTLAKLLNVDPMTAHKALSELTQQGVLYRVKGRGSFIGHAQKALNSLNIALVVNRPNLQSSVHNANHWHIVQRVSSGIMQSLKDNDVYSTVVIPLDTKPQIAEDRLLRYDAIYFIGCVEFASLIDQLLKSKKKQVVIIGPDIETKTPCLKLTMGLAESVYKGISFLAKNGYRRIAYIGSEQSYNKFEGYKKALADYGLPLVEENIVLNITKQNEGARGASILLGRGLDCDAIFVDTDLKAVGVIEYLTKQGIKVPEDIGVMGFDGMEMFSNAPPYLTSVKTCQKEIIRQSLEFLREKGSKEVVDHNIECVGTVVPNKTVKHAEAIALNVF
jgi:GntR family transcriptional regulator, arabinose operon transcriptional repressor